MAQQNQQFQANFSLNGQQVKNEIKRIKDEIDKLDVAMQHVDKTTKAGRDAFRNLAEQQKALKQELKEMNSMGRVLHNMIKDLDKASPNQLRQTMRDINKAMDNGAIKRGTKDWQEALRILGLCDKELKKINVEMKAAGGGGGFMSKMFGNMKGVAMFGAKMLGITTALNTLQGVMQQMFQLNKEFEQQMADLASVLGKSKNEIKDLERMAKQLGESTMFTASQVAGLEVNLAKLGFTTSEIKASANSVLDFAAATGAALPEAASVAGSALRAFGLDATQMSRVVSTMAVATTKSALDFEKLRTSISITFPVAKSFGFSIEDTVTLLAKLSDAGFEASSAATATRNILLNMANPASRLAKALGKPVRSIEELAPALQELEKRNISLAEAFALTDKRSVSAFKQFVAASGHLEEFKQSITDVEDELGQMVETRMDTLQGSITYLTSAWQGLMLAFSNSTGPMKKVVDGFTNITRAITRMVSSTEDNTIRSAREWADKGISKNKESWKQQADQMLGLLSPDALADYVEEYETQLSEIPDKIKEAENKVKEKSLNEPFFNGSEHSKWASELSKARVELQNLYIEEARLQYMMRRTTPDVKPETDYDKDAMKKQRGAIEIRMKNERLAEEKAFNEKKLHFDEMSLEEQEEIEKEHQKKMHTILISGYREISKLYEGNNDQLQASFEGRAIEAERSLDDALTRLTLWYKKKAEKESKEEKERKKAEAKALREKEKLIATELKLDESKAKAEAAAMKANGVDSLEAEQWYEDAIYSAKLNALHKRLELYKDDEEAQERIFNEIEKAAEDHEANVANNVIKAREHAQNAVEHIMKRKNLNDEYKQQLDALEEYHRQGLISEEQYQQARKRVIQRYTMEIAEEFVGKMNDAMNAVHKYQTAQYEYEQQQVENRYDAEIEAAEKMGRDTTALEKAKEEDLNNIKKKQIETDHNYNVAQILIDTAMSIAKGFSEYGPIMGGILAAVSTGMGAIQLATVNKQYETQKAQFYTGGYTGEGSNGQRYHRPVGIVHDGEFVANHEAVNNPQIRPMLDAIDYAQQHNTVSSMTSADLAAATGYANGGYTSRPASVGIGGAAAIGRLTNVLSDIEQNGIHAINTMSGRTGISNSLRRYEKLKSNATR